MSLKPEKAIKKGRKPLNHLFNELVWLHKGLQGDHERLKEICSWHGIIRGWRQMNNQLKLVFVKDYTSFFQASKQAGKPGQGFPLWLLLSHPRFRPQEIPSQPIFLLDIAVPFLPLPLPLLESPLLGHLETIVGNGFFLKKTKKRLRRKGCFKPSLIPGNFGLVRFLGLSTFFFFFFSSNC